MLQYAIVCKRYHYGLFDLNMESVTSILATDGQTDSGIWNPVLEIDGQAERLSNIKDVSNNKKVWWILPSFYITIISDP